LSKKLETAQSTWLGKFGVMDLSIDNQMQSQWLDIIVRAAALKVLHFHA